MKNNITKIKPFTNALVSAGESCLQVPPQDCKQSLKENIAETYKNSKNMEAKYLSKFINLDVKIEC